MVVFFLTSGLMLPYVPTILAAAMVQFLGVELFLKATWEGLNTLTWMEYAVVWATLCSCSYLGFAEGFGVGIGAAILVYVIYSFMDAVRGELSAHASD
jgi:MFS superfamily sulfate permease-like transporter